MDRLALMWVLTFLLLPGNLARAEDKTDPVAEYKTFLASLPKDDPASVTKAVDQYRAAIVPLDMDRHVKAFLDFLDLYDDICAALNKSLSQNQMKDAEETRKLQNAGLEAADDGYGQLYVRGIPEHIPGQFSLYLPKSIQRYLGLRAVESREGWAPDAALYISYARIAERTANWDRYVTDFPNSIFRKDAVLLRAVCLFLLLFGVNNTPLDARTEDKQNNIRVVYENFMRDHPNTYAGVFVRKRYECLKKEGFFDEAPSKKAKVIPSCNMDVVIKSIEGGAQAVYHGINLERTLRLAGQKE